MCTDVQMPEMVLRLIKQLTITVQATCDAQVTWILSSKSTYPRIALCATIETRIHSYTGDMEQHQIQRRSLWRNVSDSCVVHELVYSLLVRTSYHSMGDC